MNVVAERLPLPVGARFAAPSRRSRLDAWAAPKPAELVLDPWAAPLGLPVARLTTATWSAPSAATRITWMPSPATLLPPPMALRAVPVAEVATPDVAIATERAIATLRALANSPAGTANPPVDAQPPVQSADSQPPVTLSLVDPLPPLLGIELTSGEAFAPPEAGAAAVESRSNARWRLAAIVSGLGAATVAAVTLLTSVF